MGSVNPRWSRFAAPGSSGTFERGSTAASLQAWAQKVQDASPNRSTPHRNPAIAARRRMRSDELLGTALGSGGKVESLAPDRIKPFLPDSLDGLKRTQLSVERNAALGVQVSKGTANYSDGAQHNLSLEITDTGSLKGLVGFAAGWAGVEQDTETDSGYDKTYKSGDQLVHEKWDSRAQRGEYGVVVGDRFSVSVSGNAANIDELKAAVANINLAGLAALKSEGVQAN